ncbi:unnamed protein product [Heterotrigona itama]|uniref:Uncharacterized protein n=1 Tax=Heterotrigona itama TaxID=395501 RepID=A0A6V7GXD7_9HYME|nr:unnamed protein product [Heterotrigona itama]
MPLVHDFTFRFFEFNTAVAVVDKSRVGPEANVYVGIARARTCERTTITMIDGRPCVLGSAFAFASRKTRARCKFQRALRSKKEEAKSRRGPANCHEEGHNKWLLILWIIQMIPEHGKSFSLLLCHYALLLLVSRLLNVQILPLDSWKTVPVPGSPDAATRAIHQQSPAWFDASQLVLRIFKSECMD